MSTAKVAKRSPIPLRTKGGVHMHGLDLGAQAAATLKVAEDDQLAHTHDFVAHLGHQQMIFRCRLDFG